MPRSSVLSQRKNYYKPWRAHKVSRDITNYQHEGALDKPTHAHTHTQSPLYSIRSPRQRKCWGGLFERFHSFIVPPFCGQGHIMVISLRQTGGYGSASSMAQRIFQLFWREFASPPLFFFFFWYGPDAVGTEMMAKDMHIFQSARLPS
jgi:hypothetical protein